MGQKPVARGNPVQGFSLFSGTVSHLRRHAKGNDRSLGTHKNNLKISFLALEVRGRFRDSRATHQADLFTEGLKPSPIGDGSMILRTETRALRPSAGLGLPCRQLPTLPLHSTRREGGVRHFPSYRLPPPADFSDFAVAEGSQLFHHKPRSTLKKCESDG